MKLGCAVGTFTHPHYNPPYEKAIDQIAEMGFRGVELIAFQEEDLNEYYTAERIRNLRQRMTDANLELSEFILYHGLVDGLMSAEEKPRRNSIDAFARGLEIAGELGTRIVNMVSGWPPQFNAPVPYLPAYTHPYIPGIDLFEPVIQIELPRNFRAEDLWNRYLDSLAVLVDLAERSDMYLALEGHANVLVGTTDAMMRAFDRIPSIHFGTNFDTSWQFLQREYLPWSVYKLEKRILHVHLRDGDGLLCYTLPPGRGVIDWNGFVRSLKEVGFDGFLSFELGGYRRPVKYVGEAKVYMERILEEEGI